MFIQDLNHVEIISEETHLEGGSPGGSAASGVITEAAASGSRFAKANSFGTGRSSSKSTRCYTSDIASGTGFSSALAIGCDAQAGSYVQVLTVAG